MLVVVGKRAKRYAQAARDAGMDANQIRSFDESIEAGKWVRMVAKEGDVILVKGSQGSGENTIRMERAVKVLLAHPEDAERLLVRQEDEWLRR